MTGVFTAGATLTAAALNTAINSLTLNAQTGTTYTFVLTDAGKLVTASNASAQTYTIPLNASVAYSTGTVIEVLNISTGTVTLSPAGGVTLNGTTTVGAGARVRLTKTGTDTWYSSTFGAGGGLTYITSATATAAASVSINNCFTSAYTNYRIVFNGLSSVDQVLLIRLRASATDATAANYDYQALNASGASVTSSRSTLQTSGAFGAANSSDQNGISVDVYRPAEAIATLMKSSSAYSSSSAYVYESVTRHSLSTAYDGFTILTGSGTITTPTNGIRVYGYANS